MNLCKGLSHSHLESQFGVKFTREGRYVVPYLAESGDLYREKEFSQEGRPARWLGPSRPQTPYGLETLSFGERTVILTEGESCAWWLRVNFPTTPILGLPGADSWESYWQMMLARFPVIYLSFDSDEGGRRLTNKTWPDLPWARRVVLPHGLDTRDVLELHGVEAYEQLLADADYIAACTRYILETPIRTARPAGGHPLVAAAA